MTAEVTAVSANAGEQTGTSGGSVKVTVAESPGTEYVVLRESPNGGGSWREEARKTAKTPDAAIEAVIGTNDPGEHGWIAIAVRYWSPQQYESIVNRSLVKKAAN